MTDTAPRDRDDLIDIMVEKMIEQPRLIADMSRAVSTAASIVLARAELDMLDGHQP